MAQILDGNYFVLQAAEQSEISTEEWLIFLFFLSVA